MRDQAANETEGFVPAGIVVACALHRAVLSVTDAGPQFGLPNGQIDAHGERGVVVSVALSESESSFVTVCQPTPNGTSG